MFKGRLVFIFLTFLLAAPVVVVAFAWLNPQWELFAHFADTLLPDMLMNTLILLLGVAMGAGLLGTGLAWLVTMCEFPGRRAFEILFFLPFVLPAYVVAFVYLGLLDFAGPVQGFLRSTTPFQGVDIRSGHAAVITVFTLVFYPYVYMLAKIGFQAQRHTYVEASQMLGASHWRTFRTVSLPLARPSIVAGITLALMETISDFGVVSMFNYDTFTTVIYSAWEDYRSIEVAAQVASLLVLFSFILIAVERYSRGRAKFYTDQCMISRPFQLQGGRAFWAVLVSLLVVGLSFIAPLLQLLVWSWQTFTVEWQDQYWSWMFNTLALGVMAALMSVAVALMLLSIKYRSRKPSRSANLLLSFASMGYALPGSVMAIGLLFVLFIIETWAKQWFGFELLLLVSGGLGILLYAYLSRFIAVAIGPVEGAFESIHPSYVEAAQTLGANRFKIFRRVYLPLVLPGVAVAFLLVAVDVMKELPATYLLRPYGWDTLAIQVYELAAEGLYERAALPSLLLIGMSLLILLVVKRIELKS